MLTECDDKMKATELARFIDHTQLAPYAGRADFDKLCIVAKTWSTASVCVPSSWVGYCVEQLHGSDVVVCSVAGFPHGNAVSRAKLSEAQYAIEKGAREVDVVMNYGALLDGNYDFVRGELEALAQLCHQKSGAILKVILETGALREHGGELADQHIINACQICSEVGADFVKTGTGFYRFTNGDVSAATLEDVLLMRASVPENIKVKAAGGIRDFQSAQRFIHAGAERLGTSGTTAILEGATNNGSY